MNRLWVYCLGFVALMGSAWGIKSYTANQSLENRFLSIKGVEKEDCPDWLNSKGNGVKCLFTTNAEHFALVSYGSMADNFISSWHTVEGIPYSHVADVKYNKKSYKVMIFQPGGTAAGEIAVRQQ